MERPLNLDDITLKMKVKCKDGDVGIVESIIDTHNIVVAYEDGGTGIFCLDDECEDKDMLFKV